MPTIRLRTEVKAGKALVFDLSRSIDLHKLSTAHTHETAIAGKTSGLIGLNEWVTWRAKHFGHLPAAHLRDHGVRAAQFFRGRNGERCFQILPARTSL
jgi:hypothetical protein